MLGMVRSSPWRGAAALLSVFCLGAPAFAAAGPESAAELARGGLRACEDGRRLQDRDTRLAYFERGRALAQRAVALDERSADAHFALFCNMGEIMRIDGESLSALVGLHRLMSELDRTLELDPNHTDALAAKGQLLIRLPRWVGGDAQRGEQMLRQVIQQDPEAFSSRLMLAKTCDARGEREEALAFARRAMQIAQAQKRADKIAQAHAALAELNADPE